MTSRRYISTIQKERDPKATRLPFSSDRRCLARRHSINSPEFRADSRNRPGILPKFAAGLAAAAELYTDSGSEETSRFSLWKRKEERKSFLRLTAF